MNFWWNICTDEKFLYMYKGFGFSCHIVPCVAGIRHRLGYGVGKDAAHFLGVLFWRDPDTRRTGGLFFYP